MATFFDQGWGINTPFLEENNNFKKQTLMSSITSLPVPKRLLVRHNRSDDVTPSSWNYFLPIWLGLYFPSTISISNIIPHNPSQVECYPFPYGCGLRGKKIQPGQVHQMFHRDIDSSRHKIQPGIKMIFIWSLKALIKYLTWWNISLHIGGSLIVNLRPGLIFQSGSQSYSGQSWRGHPPTYLVEKNPQTKISRFNPWWQFRSINISQSI